MTDNRLYTLKVREIIEQALKPLGYSNCGQGIFLKREPEIVKVIQLLKDNRSTKECANFGVGLGIVLIPVAKAMGWYWEVPHAAIPLCQWVVDLAFVTPSGQGMEWEVDSLTVAEEAGLKIADLLLKYGIPALDRVGSREKLRDMWERDEGHYTSDTLRRDYLEILRKLR